jgi:Xaa-Pro aminopeptidase
MLPADEEIMTRSFHRWLCFLSLVLQLGMVLLAAVPAAAWEREPLPVFHERRARLAKETGGDGLIVLFGYREQEVGISTTPFRQNENFYYLTGWNEPDAMLLLVPKAAKDASRAVELDKEILFVPPHDYRREKYTGPKLGPDDADASERTGFPAVKSTTLFASELQEALKKVNKIYTEQAPQPESGEDCFVPEMLSRLKKLAPLANFGDLRSILTHMRMVKSPGEIALIRRATEASIEAHLAALKVTRPGAWEYEVAARMKYEFERLGCEWPGYPPIVGSGFYSTVLHYAQNSKQMADGELVVMDVAGAYGGYSSDITRTLPVNGRFTPRQRELYEIVLGAENAVLAAVKPGVLLGRDSTQGVNHIAYKFINTHGTDLRGQALGQYFIHGLSHSVGLNVHDPFDYTQPLQAGMVVTIEPGIYIPEEKIGVRIEDLVLVTKDGYELLTRRLPRAVEEIERLMAER